MARFLVLLAALTACAPPEALLDAPAEPELLAALAGPPLPGFDLELDADNFVAGDTNRLLVSGAPPGAEIRFAWSLSGLGDGPCPPGLRGDCAAILAPIKKVAGSVTADGAGEATLTFTMPARRAGAYVTVQAAVLDVPRRLSNPVGRLVGAPGTPRELLADLDGDGFTIAEGDCADFSASFHPTRTDPDGDTVDWNCDDQDGMDWDRDGERPPAVGGADCDDLNPAVRLAAAEVCDGVDNDCDGLVDDADASVTGQSTWYRDEDGDGYGGPSTTLACAVPADHTAISGDCADSGRLSELSYPGAPELPADGIDQDCDGGDDCFVDADGDGWGTDQVVPGDDLICDEAGVADNDADCLDSGPDAAAVFPFAAEVCNDLDDDCDGETDEGVPNDGNGCQDPGPPVLPPTRGTLHITVKTDTVADAGSDTVVPYVCLNATTCFLLGTAEYDDFNTGMTDVHVYESANVVRASIDRFRLYLSGGGTDAWRPKCIQASLDGEVVYCRDNIGLWFGTDPGDDTSNWTDPLGLTATCTSCEPSRLTEGPIVGAVGPDSARLWYRADATRRVEVRVATTPAGLATAAPVSVRYPSAEDDFTDTAVLTGLTPDTTWHYRISVDGASPVDGQLRTAPAADLPTTMRFALGSNSTAEVSQPIFTAIAADDPDAFFLAGNALDLIGTTTLGALRQFYRASIDIPERAAFLRRTPTLAVWDDLDYRGANTTGSASSKAVPLRVFEEYWPNPSFGDAGADGVWTSWSYGDIDFFLVDTRYFRNLSPGDVLGSAQATWLRDGLAASDATFKFIVSGSQFTRRGSSDGWAGYPDAFQTLLDDIAADGVGGIVMLSGNDQRRSEVRSNFGATHGYSIPEISSAPLTGTGAACDTVTWFDRFACYGSGASYVVVDVNTTLADPTVTATIKTSSGTSVASYTVYRSDLEPYTVDPWAPASTRDINGDGYGDLVVGAPGETVDGITAGGMVHLLYGSTEGIRGLANESWYQDSPNVPGGPETSDRFGDALAMGDFDADGFVDVAIGLPLEDIGTTSNSGYVHVLYGTPDGIDPVVMQDFRPADPNGTDGTVDANDRFGHAMAVGDFDGDGYDDLAVGAYGDPTTGGTVQIFYGSVSGLTFTRDALITQTTLPGGEANEAGDAFGFALVAADFDNDGRDDLAIGHPDEDVGALANAGAVTVAFATATGITASSVNVLIHQDISGVRFTAEAGDRFGAALAAGDIDGDGFPELLIGAPNEATAVADAGNLVAVQFDGGTALIADEAWGWHFSDPPWGQPDFAGDLFGAAISTGDFDRDGIDEVVVGAPGRQVGALDNAGVVVILPTSTGWPSYTGAQIIEQGLFAGISTEANDRFGDCLSVGDYDADGYADLVVGSPTETIGAITAGQVVIYEGGPAGLDPTRAAAWHQDSDSVENLVEANDEFGQSLP